MKQDILFILLLIIATYTDIKTREIPNTIPICIGILSLGDIEIMGVLAAIPFLVAGIIKPEEMGGGDIKLVAAVGLYLGFLNTITGIIVALSITTIMYTISILYKKIKRQEVVKIAVPLAPFLSIGFFIVMIITKI